VEEEGGRLSYAHQLDDSKNGNRKTGELGTGRFGTRQFPNTVAGSQADYVVSEKKTRREKGEGRLRESGGFKQIRPLSAFWSTDLGREKKKGSQYVTEGKDLQEKGDEKAWMESETNATEWRV